MAEDPTVPPEVLAHLEQALASPPEDRPEHVGRAFETLPTDGDDWGRPEVEAVRVALYAAGFGADPEGQLRAAALLAMDARREALVGGRQVDVEIDDGTWQAITRWARATKTAGVPPHVAYREAVERFVKIVPTFVVDGEAKGPSDVFPTVDELETGGSVLAPAAGVAPGAGRDDNADETEGKNGSEDGSDDDDEGGLGRSTWTIRGP